jgi:hypothetical protein
MEKETHIIKELAQGCGSRESRRMYTITAIHSGETQVVIDYTITKRFPIQKLEEAKKMYKDLEKGGGRRVYKLDEIANEELINIKENQNIK